MVPRLVVSETVDRLGPSYPGQFSSLVSPSSPLIVRLQQFRGGATTSGRTKKKKNEITTMTTRTNGRRTNNELSRKRKRRRHRQATHPMTTARTPTTTASSLLRQQQQQQKKNENLPQVQALLVPQRLPWSTLLQILSSISLCFFLVSSAKTAGQPFARAVHSTLYGSGVDRTTTKTSSQATIVPPSSLQVMLAKRLAEQMGDVLPPSHLPDASSLLGVVVSLLVGIVVATLLPQWFLWLNIRMNYQTIDISTVDTDTSTTSSSSLLLMERLQSGTTVLALVQVPRDERHLEEGKSHVLCPLQLSTTIQQQDDDDDSDNIDDHATTATSTSSEIYFDLHHRRYYYNPQQQQQDNDSVVVSDGGPCLHSSLSLRDLTTTTTGSSGLVTTRALQQAEERYRHYNTLILPVPTIYDAMMARMSTPLVVLQLSSKLLHAMEEDWKSSVLGLLLTVLHHYWNARQSIISAKELANEVGQSVTNVSDETVWALRPAATLSNTNSSINSNKKRKKKRRKKQTTNEIKWKKLSAVDLLPGDIFVLSNTASVVPVDALLLDGTCVTNEAVLTGESVPQTKMPLEVDSTNENCYLDMAVAHRHSILFAGTSLLHCTNNTETETPTTTTTETLSVVANGRDGIPKLPKASSGARFLALRTGSYSSRGELLRALLARNSNHVGSISNSQTERDALRLIGSLSCFAALACASLFYGPNKVETFAFRRVIQCTRIIMASIPSDLPLSLSSVAHSCSKRLKQEADVVCSEPGALLTAAHVQCVVFDKTGTLTADTQALSRVVKPKCADAAAAAIGMDHVILAGCHSLVDLQDDAAVLTNDNQHFVGDPLDLVSLQYVGWTYDRKQDAYVESSWAVSNNNKKNHGPVKLWQIRTFPFDATRRTSSALLLVLYADGNCRLWKTIKGSPDIIAQFVETKHRKWYNKQMKELGGQGLRTVAMAAREVSPGDELASNLFVDGFPNATCLSDGDCRDVFVKARRLATSLHRNDFEGFADYGATPSKGKSAFDLVGFVCFDAAIRPSTRRIIQELKNAQVNVVMLTGDGVDAAISVAEKAGLLSPTGSIAVMDVSSDDSKLVWKMLKKDVSKRERYKHVDESSNLSKDTTTMLCDAVEKGHGSLIITGRAAEVLLSADGPFQENEYSRLCDNLFRVSVFARASPGQKRLIVSNLKDHSDRKVLMCGDGVNDVAAMKVADVGVALLNGYGDEGSNIFDIEDERRMHQLSQQKIGSNRRKHRPLEQTKDPLSLAGVGSSRAASAARIQMDMDKALKDIMDRARMQQKNGNYTLRSMFRDIKDSSSAVFRAVNDERKRNTSLQKGGGAAARILAKEDKLRREIIKKARTKDVATDATQQGAPSFTIKPGEASLAAPFSCLRPAIDGVEALMRMGIAAAACASSVQQSIALNCIMSCYNLATLYRDGFRYGKYMWNVELYLGSMISQAVYQSSTTLRPRLPMVHPEQSLFHPSAILSVCSQAFIHLATLTIGVRMANTLEKTYPVSNRHASKVRWRDDVSRTSAFGTLAKALAASPRSPDAKKQKKRGGIVSLLGRPPFRPNYATNIVFFLSTFQYAVTTVTTHKGKPFYGTILESRQLCLWISASILFVVAGITESFPQANAFLELRPLPSRRYKMCFLALLLIDFLGCFAAKQAIEGFDKSQMDVSRIVEGMSSKSAADKEEELLAEEEEGNRRLLLAMLLAMSTMVIRLGF